MINILIFVGAAIFGGAASFVALSGRKFIDLEKDKGRAEDVVNMSLVEAEKIVDDTKKRMGDRRTQLQEEEKQKQERLALVQSALDKKETSIKRREELNSEIELRLASQREETQSLQDKIRRGEKDVIEKLAAKIGRSMSDMKAEILEQQAATLEEDSMEKLAKQEEYLKETAEKTAKRIVVGIIQRLCSPTSVETRVVTVKVPKDHMKGEVVGRNAENILEFERLLAVDVVFNDLPGTISISAFNLVQRRIAQKAMEKLVHLRGTINKAVVARIIKEAEKETDEELYVIGKKALEKMGMDYGNKEFCRIVGRLQYRTSYGQNIMKHSMEVGWVAIMLGSELGLNVKTCRIGGFLHDLGKAIDQDPGIDKPHDLLSKELMEKFGFSDAEVHAAWTHHDAIPIETAEALLVKAADAISAGRPGARAESFDRYIQRMRALQEAAESFAGVTKAFAISAGRELRAIVNPDEIDDNGIKDVAKKLAAKIEEELTYPGQIKVNVIRKTKHTEIAK